MKAIITKTIALTVLSVLYITSYARVTPVEDGKRIIIIRIDCKESTSLNEAHVSMIKRIAPPINIHIFPKWDKQKINFTSLSEEMNKAQEDMSQMDPALQKEDANDRKTAENILKTGIRS
jgi:hypothetical protein